MFQHKQSYEWYSRAPQNYIHDVNFKRWERSRMERGEEEEEETEQSTHYTT